MQRRAAQSVLDPLPDGAIARYGSARLRHRASVNALRFSQDGRRLFSASSDGTARVWDVASGKQLQCFQTGASEDLTLSPDEQFIVLLKGDRSTATLLTPEIQVARAIQELEYLGTSGSRELLKQMSQGDPLRPQTRQAKAALDRITRRDPSSGTAN